MGIYEELTNNGYEGNAYKLYTYNLRTSSSFSNTVATQTMPTLKTNIGKFYIRETYGTLVCDESFLIDKYGVNGQLYYLAKSDNFIEEDKGIIITDYVADSFLVYNPGVYTSYNDFLI